MVHRIIEYNNRYYYLYDSYASWNEAKNNGINAKRRNPRSHWYIIKGESGGVFPRTRYYLYIDRVRNLGRL